MSSNFIPDYNPSDDSFQIGGTIRTDQGMPALMLDRVLTGFSPGNTPATATEALDALRGFLTQTPLEVLQMFKPFVFKKDVDWDDQYGAVEGIMATFQPKSFSGWVAEFEAKTGLIISQGAVKFLESLRLLLRPEWLKDTPDWVAEFEAKTGLIISQGVRKFIESLVAKMKELRLDWITEFEAKTNLNIDEGLVKFLESLRDAQKANRLDWITDFEAKTGLDVDAGAAAFLTSMLGKLKPEWAKDDAVIGGKIGALIDAIANNRPGAAASTNRPLADAIAAIIANIKDVTDTRDGIAKALAGEDTSTVAGGFDMPGQEMLAALQRAAGTLSEHSRVLQLLQAKQDTSISKGALFNVNFAGVPNGPLPADFKVTYNNTTGTSTIGVSGGTAGWNIGNNADRDALIVYQKPTLTDFQVIRGTMSTPPQQAGGTGGTPYFYALGRVSADGRSYVWARGYCTGLLQFKADLGCTVDGVDTVWQQGIALTWSLDMHLAVGVGTNARQYQVWSGNQLVTTYTEQMVGGAYKSLMGNTWKVVPVADSGTFTLTYKTKTTAAIAWNATGIQVAAALSALTAGETWTATGNATTAGGPWYLNPPADQVATEALTGNAANLRSGLSQGTLTLTRDDQRLWGCIAQVRAGTGLSGTKHSGRLAGSSVADNLAPSVLGTYARMSRGTSATVSWNGGTHVGLPNNFFTTAVESPDIDANTSDGTMTLTKTCPYTISARIECNNVAALIPADGTLGLEVMKGGKGSWIPVADGPPVNVAQGEPMVGNWVHYFEAGDKIRLCTSRAGQSSNTLTGDSNGVLSYFSIAGIG